MSRNSDYSEKLCKGVNVLFFVHDDNGLRFNFNGFFLHSFADDFNLFSRDTYSVEIFMLC